jgi:hypothetical protein
MKLIRTLAAGLLVSLALVVALLLVLSLGGANEAEPEQVSAPAPTTTLPGKVPAPLPEKQEPAPPRYWEVDAQFDDTIEALHHQEVWPEGDCWRPPDPRKGASVAEQVGVCKRRPDLAKGIVRSWSFRLLGRPVMYLGFAEDAKLLRWAQAAEASGRVVVYSPEGGYAIELPADAGKLATKVARTMNTQEWWDLRVIGGS